MGSKYKNKFYYFVYVLILAGFLPFSVFAQESVFGVNEDNLLEQYLFPISSYLESGSVIGKNGAECTEYYLYNSQTKAWESNGNCQTLGNTGVVQKTTEGIGVYTSGLAGFSYNLTVSQEGNYVVKVRAANGQDNFSNLTNQQLGYIFDNSNTDGYDSYRINADKSLEILADNYSQENVISEIRKYEMFRSLVFSVYLDGEKKGYLIIKNTDLSQIQEGSLLLGNIKPGDHNITINFLSDYYFDFSNLWVQGTCEGGADKDGMACNPSDVNACLSSEIPDCVDNKCTAGTKKDQACQEAADCPADIGLCVSSLRSAYNEFANADLDNNKILDVNPVIAGIGLAPTEPTTDVIGVRIYTNVQHKDALTWYKENVINASPGVKEIKVDGYQGVQDDRTVYVNAANLDEQNMAFFTNIYVIAYNQNAAPSTINIFDQMLANWVFNKNIFDKYPLRNESELIKDKFRRDTIRLADAFNLGRILESYKASHGGKCPELKAGTFVINHSISTWPSWQATLGNQLGSALPVDPLNIMATGLSNQHDCQDPVDKTFCQNICARDADGQAMRGCPSDQQCYGDYCSICRPGYDPATCWDEINLEFDKSVPDVECAIESGVKYSFNLGGTDCENNGAFVYQYASVDDGNVCYFYNRFEYTEEDVCSPGECYFNDGDDATSDCYRAGACLEYKDANDNLVYRNTYCYQGTWRNSCGDGFIQAQCGEICDPNVPLTEGQSWCDQLYGNHDWYNEQNVKASCTAQCELGGTEGLSISDCGGFCGDRVVQAQGGEQCDQGNLATQQPKSIGGLSRTSQYMCSGTQGGAPLLKSGSQCENYVANWWSVPNTSCSSLANLDLENPAWVANYSDDSLVALGGFSASYKFNITNAGHYNLQLVAANLNDKLSDLSKAQLDYLFNSKEANDYLFNIKGICYNSSTVTSCNQDSDCAGDNPDKYCSRGGLDIPLYGLVYPDDPKKYDLLRSLIFAVYVDGQQPEHLKGFAVLPGNNTAARQTGNLNIGSLAIGEHTFYVKFVGDNYYVPGTNQTVLNSIAVGGPDANALDINPVIYSVSIFSPALGVGNCQSFGGWCGDGLLQMEFGEQCDINNYQTPKPENTRNIVKNSSFEGVFTPWQVGSGSVSLDNNQFYMGSSSLRINSGASGGEVELIQYNNFLQGKSYRLSFRLKKQEGSFINYLYDGNATGMKLQLGNLAAEWANNINISGPAADVSGWDLYTADFQPATNSYQFKISFNTAPNTVFYLDMVQIMPLDSTAMPQYQCGKDPITGNLCQYRGGYCGDGVVQTSFGEGCDDRVGMSCANNEGCGQYGFCNNGKCQSVACNEYCRSTYCGDGIIQRPNAEGVYEICDWKIDPYCAKDCQHINMGGSCTSDPYVQNPCNPNTNPSCRTCNSNLSCTVRNYGDDQSQRKCLGARGASGCLNDSQCILGYYCEVATGKCKEEVSTYLRYHPEDQSRLTLPIPADAPLISYDINLTRCPDLRPVIIGRNRYLIDYCTYTTWMSADNTNKLDDNWKYAEATADGCLAGTRLPTITELYSLVRQSNSGFLYADKATLKLCANKCSYDLNDYDYCDDCGDDNYIYWSSTCTKKNAASGVCEKALAVNFKYGSIEEFDARTVGDKFKVRCLKESQCGDGEINSKEGETCEFYKGPGGQLIEKEITGASCRDFGYDAGFLHCDPVTCGFVLDNCVLNTRTDQNCAQVCQGRKALACQSVGLGIDKISERKDTDGTYIIADDNQFMDIDAGGNCVVKEFATTSNACNYKFTNRAQKCLDTLNNRLAPFNSEYSYCNCDESSAATYVSLYNCTGTDPAYATLCTGDSANLLADAVKRAVNFCTVATKCEYRCNEGYVLVGSNCIRANLVFVTSDTYSGNLGGIAGANAKCQAQASTKGLAGSFKAWISDSANNPAGTFNHSGDPYYLLNGEKIADNWADLTDGTLQRPINVDINGTVLTSSSVWTNTNIDGSRWAEDDCTNWTDVSVSGREGNALSSSSQWTANSSRSCSNSDRLYCFSQ